MPDLSDAAVTVTGGLGFVGSNLVIELVDRGAAVTVIDRPRAAGGPDDTSIEPVREAVDVIRADVRDRGAIEGPLARSDIVYHLAARTSRPGSIDDPIGDMDVNCLGTLTVLEAVAAAPTPPRVVFTSSQSAVGAHAAGAFDGRTQGEVVDVYGANKRAAEAYCRAFHLSRGVPTVVVRPTNVYGPRGTLDTTAIDTFLDAALADDPLPVFEPGTQRRDPIYVDDVVDAFVRLGRADGVAGERFALGTGRSHRILDVAETIVRVAGSGTVELVPWPDSWEALKLGDLRADPSRLRTATGWSPTTDLVTGLERTIEYYRSERDRR